MGSTETEDRLISTLKQAVENRLLRYKRVAKLDLSEEREIKKEEIKKLSNSIFINRKFNTKIVEIKQVKDQSESN